MISSILFLVFTFSAIVIDAKPFANLVHSLNVPGPDHHGWSGSGSDHHNVRQLGQILHQLKSASGTVGGGSGDLLGSSAYLPLLQKLQLLQSSSSSSSSSHQHNHAHEQNLIGGLGSIGSYSNPHPNVVHLLKSIPVSSSVLEAAAVVAHANAQNQKISHLVESIYHQNNHNNRQNQHLHHILHSHSSGSGSAHQHHGASGYSSALYGHGGPGHGGHLGSGSGFY